MSAMNTMIDALSVFRGIDTIVKLGSPENPTSIQIGDWMGAVGDIASGAATAIDVTVQIVNELADAIPLHREPYTNIYSNAFSSIHKTQQIGMYIA